MSWTIVGHLSMFYGVSNYNLRAMEKTNICILLFLIFLTSLCNSNDYIYDNYNYDEYNYDYDNQKSEDYTDYYNQGFNDYYDLAPPNPPPLPIPTPPFMGKMTFLL